MKAAVIRNRSILIGLFVLFLGVMGQKCMSGMAKPQSPKSSFRMVNVLTKTAVVTNHTVLVELSGRLVAKNRIDLFSEVSGVLNSRNFRAGNRYQSGQVIASIDKTELMANIQAQKSQLLNSISQILPDLSIDYPSELEKWKAYHAEVRFDKTTPTLPEVTNAKLKVFLSSKNVYTTYFGLKSSEERLQKYSINAPFSGVLSATEITSGALVRAGQKLGTFIQPNVFELEASVALDDLKYLTLGVEVELAGDGDEKYRGKILRINPAIDPGTQTVTVYIEVNNTTLKEGQYLTASVRGSVLQDVVEVPRNQLIEESFVYTVVNDTVLEKTPIEVVYNGKTNAYVTGLDGNKILVNQVLSNAYEGMIVKAITSK